MKNVYLYKAEDFNCSGFIITFSGYMAEEVYKNHFYESNYIFIEPTFAGYNARVDFVELN